MKLFSEEKMKYILSENKPKYTRENIEEAIVSLKANLLRRRKPLQLQKAWKRGS